MDSDNVLTGLGEWQTNKNTVPSVFEHSRGLHMYMAQNTEKPPTSIFKHWLITLLDNFATEHTYFAEILRSYFFEQQSADALAQKLHMSETTARRRRKDAEQKFAQFIENEEKAVREAHHTELYKRLETPSCDQLFGRTEALEQLLTRLTDQTNLPIISVEGIGGLGKTTLLDTAVRQAIQQELFADVGWVSARTRQLSVYDRIENVTKPLTMTCDLVEQLARQLMGNDAVSIPFNLEETAGRLQSRFKAIPHLIVFDNVDTLADPEVLIKILGEWTNPTKFLLSTRRRLPQGKLYNIFPYVIPELSEADALALLRHKARQANMIKIAEAEDNILSPIYAVVGGNPLALLLIVGQLRHMNILEVIESLRLAPGRSIDEMYTYIYEQAWQVIPNEAREVWLATRYWSSVGGDLDYLVDVSTLERHVVKDALEVLIRWHLVHHHRGHGLDASRYSIHSLTTTFLNGVVQQWMDPKQLAT